MAGRQPIAVAAARCALRAIPRIVFASPVRHYFRIPLIMNRTNTLLLAAGLFIVLTSEKCNKTPEAAACGAPAAAASIFGSRWNLATLAGAAVRMPEGKENPYLSIAEDLSVSGFGGCNRLVGQAKVEGSAVSFPGLGSTKMYCHDTQETESSFLKALNATNTFKLDGDKLVLLDKATELATLIKGK